MNAFTIFFIASGLALVSESALATDNAGEACASYPQDWTLTHWIQIEAKFCGGPHYAGFYRPPAAHLAVHPQCRHDYGIIGYICNKSSGGYTQRFDMRCFARMDYTGYHWRTDIQVDTCVRIKPKRRLNSRAATRE